MPTGSETETFMIYGRTGRQIQILEAAQAGRRKNRVKNTEALPGATGAART